MNSEFKKETNNKEFIECQSAFGGFGIYKTNKFKDCYYRSLIDLTLFNPELYKKYLHHIILNI